IISVVISLISRQHNTLQLFVYDTATTETYTLSLHDALPISSFPVGDQVPAIAARWPAYVGRASEYSPGRGQHHQRLGLSALVGGDRKSTRLNSSHLGISYAVFCLKKKKI